MLFITGPGKLHGLGQQSSAAGLATHSSPAACHSQHPLRIRVLSKAIHVTHPSPHVSHVTLTIIYKFITTCLHFPLILNTVILLSWLQEQW